MNFFLLLMLVGSAIRCDDTSNYYVIEMPEEDPPRTPQKPFKVYWNVPTMQCKSKRIPFENLYEKFGIIQNKNERFRGEKIAILYDPGLFPALLKNESSGKFKFRNGGVPQEGDLDKHLDAFKNVLVQSIPETSFNGVAIIDFESWRPVFRQNFGVLVPYKDVSYEIERKMHWWWPKNWVQAEAKKRFEDSARKFMRTTLALAKEMRPNAIWGYYGFPYCFNMQNNNMMEKCADKVPEENDSIYWLWSESTALYPSIYSSRELSSSQLAGLVRGRVREAARVRSNGTPILPYFWFRYRDGGFLTEADLNTVLKMLYKSYASGFIIWGSSTDVNTVEKCNKLHNYTYNVMGPAIAKYTNNIHKIDDKIENDTLLDVQHFISNHDGTSIPNNNITETTTHKFTVKETITVIDKTNKTNENFSTLKPSLEKVQYDPEFHWNPPDNYTQDIVQYVEEELKKYNFSLQEAGNDTEFKIFRHSSLVDIILSTIIDNILTNNTELDKSKEKQSEIGDNSNTVLTDDSSTEIGLNSEATTAKLDTTISESFEETRLFTETLSTTIKYHIDTENSTESEIKLSTLTDTSYYTNLETTSSSTTNDPLISTTLNYTMYNEDTFFIPSVPVTKSNIKSETSTVKSDTTTRKLIVEDSRWFNETLSTDNNNYTAGTISFSNEENATSISSEISIESVTSTQTPVELLDKDISDTNIVDIEVKIHIPMQSKNSKKGHPRRIYEDIRRANLTSLSLTSTSATDDQVTGSATRDIGPQYFIYIFCYLSSLSKLCDVSRNGI